MVTSIDQLDTLKRGKITVEGEFLWGSNYTFLAKVEGDNGEIQAVYKPARGERPLWDFPPASLAKREAAAYQVSQALGWELVPPTIFRKKAPIGPGSLQLFIEHDPEYHYFNFTQEDVQRLRPTVLFDILVNNADRKGSHLLLDNDRHLWLIDHGVCFHVEDKLRTVIWDFMNEPIPPALIADLDKLADALMQDTTADADGLPKILAGYLSQAEIKALAKRAKNLVQTGTFPEPDPKRRPYPWPAI